MATQPVGPPEEGFSSTPAPSTRAAIRRPVLMLSVLVVLICVFTVVGVAHIMELGSAAFFVVVVAGAMVLMCFFCGLIAYARARVMAVRIGNSNGALAVNGSSNGRRIDSVPVFYYLQTVHRPSLPPVDDDEYWSKSFIEGDIKVIKGCPPNKDDHSSKASINAVLNDQCPICLCDIDIIETATGVSECCKRPIHIQCAQKYFNSVQKVQCPLCRHVFEQNATSTTANTSLSEQV